MIKKPSYRFADYTELWEEKKLGNLGSVEMCRRIFKEETSAEFEIPFFKIGTFGGEADTYITREKFEEYKTKFAYPQRGDLLLSASGSIGRVVEYDGDEAYYQDSNIVWLNHHGKINNKFLKAFYEIVSWSGIEGTTIKRLYNKNILETDIYLPTLPEQTAIGSFFQDIDQLVSLQQRKLEVLKEQKKTYLKLLFPARGQTKPALRFAGFEDDWKEVKLGEVFDIVTDYVANGSFESLRNNVKTYEKDNFAYMIRLQDASNSWKGPWLYTDEKGYNFLSKSRLFKDDILMSNVGTVGRFFQVPELDRPMTLAPNSVLIRSTSSNNQFLYFMMLTANIQDQIAMRKTPGVQDKINKTDFKKVIATLPTLPEQEAIGSFFQDLDKVIAKQEEKVNQLKESKQTLLRKMFI